MPAAEPVRAVRSDGVTAEPVPIQWDPSISVFASERFLESVGDDFGWLAGIDQSGTRRCVLPYTIVRKAGVRLVRFRVETLSCGPTLDVDEERSFLNGVVRYFRRTGADVIIPASTNTIFRTYPDSAMAAPYGTYIVGLAVPEDALWAAVNASHRRQVRAATKMGVCVRSAADCLPTAHAIIRDTFRKSSMPFMGLEALARMVQGLAGHGHVFVAEHGGRIHSCAVIALSQYSAYYMYGGSIEDAVPGAMHLLHWEAMRRCRESGVLRYDFCGARIDPDPGSKAAGLATFKQRFGADLHRGFMWKCGLRRLTSAVYSVAVRCLRGGDIVDAEHHKLGASPGASAP